MRLAILVTNTDVSPFSHRHPRDGEKFRQLIATLRTDWECAVFDVTQGNFPQDATAFDGVVVTGSPASVHDSARWIDQLKQVIRKLHAARTPMFGACFGHQAIAQALGGKVEDNPDGWVLGAVTTFEQGVPIRLYAAHKEQVTHLPVGATIRWRSETLPIAGFAIGQHVLTTQYHPEMTDDFIAALVDELAPDLPVDVIETARSSLSVPAERDRIAADIIGFFETAYSA